ncbi:MAG: hypothetical protein R6X12_02555, partial [bacterium]
MSEEISPEQGRQAARAANGSRAGAPACAALSLLVGLALLASCTRLVVTDRVLGAETAAEVVPAGWRFPPTCTHFADLLDCELDCDVLVLSVRGGWGDSPLEYSSDLVPILEGIRARVESEDVPILVEIRESGSPARMVSSGLTTKGEPREKVQQMVVGRKSKGPVGGCAGAGCAGPGRDARA